MDELTLIGASVGKALLACSVWLVPLLIYRKLRGIPLVPDHAPIDMKSRKERNRLMFSVVGAFGMAAYFFFSGMPITALICSAIGFLALMCFEYLDRATDENT
jgi:hypothetical protein